MGKKDSLAASSAYPPLLGLAFARAREETVLQAMAGRISVHDFARECSIEILKKLPERGQAPWKDPCPFF